MLRQFSKGVISNNYINSYIKRLSVFKRGSSVLHQQESTPVEVTSSLLSLTVTQRDFCHHQAEIDLLRFVERRKQPSETRAPHGYMPSPKMRF